MSDRDLQNYIRQMLRELADSRPDDSELGDMAFRLRLLAGNAPKPKRESPAEHVAIH